MIGQFLEALKTGRMQAMKDAAAAAVELGLHPGSSIIDRPGFHGNIVSAMATPGKKDNAGRPVSLRASPGGGAVAEGGGQVAEGRGTERYGGL